MMMMIILLMLGKGGIGTLKAAAVLVALLFYNL